MSGHFPSRLPPGHAALRFSRIAAIGFLSSDSLVPMTHPGAPTLAECREWRATIECGFEAPVTPQSAAVRQLPLVAARIVLCNVLQVPTQSAGIQSTSERTAQPVAAALGGAAVAGGGLCAAAAPAVAGVQGPQPPPAAAGRGLGAAGPAAAALGVAAQPPQISVGCWAGGGCPRRSNGAGAAAGGGSGDTTPGLCSGSCGGGTRGWTRRHAGRRALSGSRWCGSRGSAAAAGCSTCSRRRRAGLGSSSSTDVNCGAGGTGSATASTTSRGRRRQYRCSLRRRRDCQRNSINKSWRPRRPRRRRRHPGRGKCRSRTTCAAVSQAF